MASETSSRKDDQLEIVLNGQVTFLDKSNGFDNYEFLHDATTGVEIEKIDLTTEFFGHKINLPFMISSMTGGSEKSTGINEKLAVVASELGIPIGIGSQRQALENNNYHNSYKIIRKNASDVPVFANIGAAEISLKFNRDDIIKIIDLVEADGLIIHINPLQELIQKEGNPQFKDFLQNLSLITAEFDFPVIVKEVGAGISKHAAKKLLDSGARGIDVAGAGGTSWAGVELLRKGEEKSDFWDWGLPTSYCVRTVSELKADYNFTLIGSGGLKNGFDIAKAIALGADITASAKPLLDSLSSNGAGSVIDLINGWFDTVRKIMFLTGSQTLSELDKTKLIPKKNLY